MAVLIGFQRHAGKRVCLFQRAIVKRVYPEFVARLANLTRLPGYYFVWRSRVSRLYSREYLREKGWKYAVCGEWRTERSARVARKRAVNY